VEQVRRARTRFPDDLRLLQLEAQALHQSGQTERGLGLLRDALKERASEPALHLALAGLYADDKRLDEATRVLQDATTSFPDNASILFQLGSAFEQQKRFSDAEQAFRKVLTTEPEHAPTLNYLGYMLADRGDRLEESVELIRRALQIDPLNGAYLDSLGWAYFRMNRMDLAEPPLRQAAEQLVTNSVIQDHYADLLFRLGRFDDAAAAWRRSLDGDGESIDRAVIERKMKAARDRAGESRRTR
jgi:Flp pilus assembly protein TadD